MEGLYDAFVDGYITFFPKFDWQSQETCHIPRVSKLKNPERRRQKSLNIHTFQQAFTDTRKKYEFIFRVPNNHGSDLYLLADNADGVLPKNNTNPNKCRLRVGGPTHQNMIFRSLPKH